jgi:hypothetical protein
MSHDIIIGHNRSGTEHEPKDAIALILTQTLASFGSAYRDSFA